jgi:hypothetical protein
MKIDKGMRIRLVDAAATIFTGCNDGELLEAVGDGRTWLVVEGRYKGSTQTCYDKAVLAGYIKDGSVIVVNETTDLLQLANLAHEIDEGQALIETESAAIFPSMRDFCYSVAKEKGDQAVLDMLDSTIESYWAARFDPQGIGRTKAGCPYVKSFTVNTSEKGLNPDGMTVIKRNGSKVTVRGMPSEWYAAYSTITRALAHDEPLDWGSMTKNEIETVCKPRKATKKAPLEDKVAKKLMELVDCINASENDAEKSAYTAVVIAAMSAL